MNMKGLFHLQLYQLYHRAVSESCIIELYQLYHRTVSRSGASEETQLGIVSVNFVPVPFCIRTASTTHTCLMQRAHGNRERVNSKG